MDRWILPALHTSKAVAQRVAVQVGQQISEHPYIVAPFALTGALSLATYLGPLLVQNVFYDTFSVNLKKKYNAEWALVTGASSGIGKAIVEKLCRQKINVVVVALDDKLLEEAYAHYVATYPDCKFRRVGVDLSQGDYLTPIAQATEDIDVTLVFNNAGFITTGFFFDIPLQRNLQNYECNATSAVKITHLFLRRMVEKRQRGLLAYTSSSAGFLPNPLSAMYSSTKAFLTLFAASLAPEVRSLGIDVVVVHPSPTNTNFFNNAGGLSALLAFKRFAASPANIADCIVNSAGRVVVRDQGLITIFFRLLLKPFDFNLFCEMAARFAHLSGDHVTFLRRYRERASSA